MFDGFGEDTPLLGVVRGGVFGSASFAAAPTLAEDSGESHSPFAAGAGGGAIALVDGPAAVAPPGLAPLGALGLGLAPLGALGLAAKASCSSRTKVGARAMSSGSAGIVGASGAAVFCASAAPELQGLGKPPDDGSSYARVSAAPGTSYAMVGASASGASSPRPPSGAGGSSPRKSPAESYGIVGATTSAVSCWTAGKPMAGTGSAWAGT
mmetsp:Transcript_89105/g.157890  ORF Transcript_89105/g.157890 Transcript_89105/m.157890 type:complete len:210 (-) Transcript_89105:116-745(-)